MEVGAFMGLASSIPFLAGMDVDESEGREFTLVYGCWKRFENYATLCHNSGRGAVITSGVRLFRMFHENKGFRDEAGDFAG